MKKLYLLLGVLLAMGSCIQEKDPVYIEITGMVTNAKDNVSVEDITLSINHYKFLESWWGYRRLDWDKTNAKGEFRLSFYQSNDFLSAKPELNIDEIPSKYQQGARINGKYYKLLCLGSGYEDLEDNGNYLVELIPLTKAYFVQPTIPAGWENDTLMLKVSNLILDTNSKGVPCGTDSVDFTLRLNNQEEWLNLQKARNLHLGDVLTIKYTIKNGTVKKSGIFDKSCAIGDTTAVELPLFQ